MEAYQTPVGSTTVVLAVTLEKTIDRCTAGCGMRGQRVEIRFGAVAFIAEVYAVTGCIVSARGVDQPVVFTSVNGGRSWRLARVEVQ
jgi:hypothetical protein